MSKILLSLFIVVSFASCTKNNNAPAISGTYSGTFTRYLGDSIYTSDVKFFFLTNIFSGTTSTGYFPIICPGNFQTTPDSIEFNNPCTLPANVDESFVLSGNYKLQVQGDSVTFSRVIGDFIYEEDIYRLKMQ
jgi:hypothetical protein